MAFARRLRKLLSFRDTLMPGEFAEGEPLESVLERYLLVVESTAEPDTRTSILLLDGTTLNHGAGPKLPREYLDAINGSQIGPVAGSCGTAAFFGKPIYVSDICNDPLWENYRHLALKHDLRACWSTPIRNPEGKLLGTFAVYHERPRTPTAGELASIQNITEHVARAIMFYRGAQYETQPDEADKRTSGKPSLRLVSSSDAPGSPPAGS